MRHFSLASQAKADTAIVICFELTRNGKKLALAGVDGLGVLSATMTNLTGVPHAHLDFNLGGLESGPDRGEQPHLGWAHGPAEVGDRFRYRIVMRDVVDPPCHRNGSPSTSRRRYTPLHALRDEQEEMKKMRLALKRQIPIDEKWITSGVPVAKPTPFICFELSLNGQKLAVGGIPGHAVVSVHLHCALRVPRPGRKRRDPAELRLSLGGMDFNRHYEDAPQLRWVDQAVKVGDRITIRILRRTEADPPKSRRFWGKPLVDYSDETPRAALRRHRRRLATVDKQLAKLAVEIAKLQAAARSSELRTGV